MIANQASAKRAARHASLITVAFGLFWVPVIIFAGLADEVARRAPLLFDTAILSTVRGLRSPLLTHVFLFITALGEPIVIGGAGLILLCGLLAVRELRAAVVLLVGVGGAVLADQLLKLAFARSRPDVGALITQSSYSFPSGHSMVSASAAGVIILLLWHTRGRVPAIVIGVLGTFLIGCSRIYLGVHYPSDVLAGWCVGVTWAAVTGSLLLGRPFDIKSILKV